MAELVAAVATSHSPMLSVPAHLWFEFGQADRSSRSLIYPPHGRWYTYEEGLRNISNDVRMRMGSSETFEAQSLACVLALDCLADTLRESEPDVVVIISDDQDEWFYDDMMPMLALCWGSTTAVIPRPDDPRWSAAVNAAIRAGYGDVAVTVPVAEAMGGYAIDRLSQSGFDLTRCQGLAGPRRGEVARRFDGEMSDPTFVHVSAERMVGLPHGFSFVVKRLFDNAPPPILPIFQNTCYPPNQLRPARAFNFGRAIRTVIEDWSGDARVAVIASGGLSHYVVDEELDRRVLDALALRDSEALCSLPDARLKSASSEIVNWVTLAGVLDGTSLEMELLDYVPVCRSEAGTGGGWAFCRWL